MPVVKDAGQAREIIERIARTGKSLPCFCTESVYTTEAVFLGAEKFRKESGITGNLPLIIAFTASYEDRQQLKNYTGLSDFREGMLAVRSDIERLSRAGGPFHRLDIIVHLDHAQPGKDDWILEEHGDMISSVMWDCSHYGMDDNISMMQEFVSANRSRFVIEGAVDEIYNYKAGTEKPQVIDNITEPETAERYFHETGADLLVANLGTEHRRTEGTVMYHRKEAREISRRVGRRLVLHGTSSLSTEELHNLPGDGILKVNLWGNLESVPGKSLVENLLKNLEGQISKDKARQLVMEGILVKDMLKKDYNPSIAYLTEKYRRDEVYLPVAFGIVKQFYYILYGNGKNR